MEQKKAPQRMVPEFLHNSRLKLLIFGGKGGVGKTTMASATAVHFALATNAPSGKLLLVSTDPAHSLSDSLGILVSDEFTPVPVKGAGGAEGMFYARQLCAEKLTRRFRKKNGPVIKKIAERGTYFDDKDVASFFDLSLPGMDEVMAVIEISRMLAQNTFDRLIIDTAPTGHTVRMLEMPVQMKQWIRVMDSMLEKHRYMAAKFTRKQYVKDECDLFLGKLTREIEQVDRLLRDNAVTRFIPVMIPEMMSVNETKKLIGSVTRLNIPIHEIVLNRVAKTGTCPFCHSMHTDQKQLLSAAKKNFDMYDLVLVERFKDELNGLDDLLLLSQRLSGRFDSGQFNEHEQSPVLGDNRGISPSSVSESSGSLPHTLLDSQLRYILVGGKGGVGKTSVASALGLYLSDQHTEKKVLIFSTDPAHSLSDAFETKIGNQILSVYKNLYACEINADQLLKDFKSAYQQEIQALFNRFLGNKMDVKFDREVMTGLFSLAPPGLDEIMALDKIMELKAKNRFDLIVIDTSPTGHLLRFLEMPGLVREWLNAFFAMLLKYRGTVRLTKVAQKALALSKNVRKIQENLTDGQTCAFAAVTIPEAMGMAESRRLLDALEKSRLPCNHLFVNMVMPKTGCPACLSRRISQQRHIQKIHMEFPDMTIVQIPLFPNDIHGLGDLKRLAQHLFKEENGNG